MVYSFLNVNATMAGPGGVLNLAAGAAAAEEGLTIEPVEDKNVMTIGADGKGQHSLIASDAVTLTESVPASVSPTQYAVSPPVRRGSWRVSLFIGTMRVLRRNAP